MKPLSSIVIALTCLLLCSVSDPSWSQEASSAAWVLKQPEARTPSPRALPIVDANNGEIRALLLLDEVAENLSDAQVLDQILANTANDQTQELSPMVASQLPEVSQDMALLCQEGSALSLTLSSLTQNCLLSNAEDAKAQPSVLSDVQAPKPVHAGGQWRLAVNRDTKVDVSLASSSIMPSLSPSLDGQLSGQQYQVNGLLTLPQSWWVQLYGAHGDYLTSSAALSPVRIQSDQFGLGVGRGALGGQLVGRVVQLPDAGFSSKSLDLDLMWRMPWQGKLTLGTRAVVNPPFNQSQWPLNALPEKTEDTSTDLVPYVRYHQDL